MKKILCFCLMIMISANVLAFGGGGHGRVSSQYKKGVSSFGIYYGGDGQVDIDIRDCNDETETWTGVCCPNELVYLENEEQKCCNTEGYAIDGIGKCVRTCPTKQVLVNDECVDLCKEYQSKICAQECNWKTGEGIPESSETVCGNNMHCSGEDDRCVCNETFEAKDAGSCECPNKWVKQGDICVNLCANYQETVCKQICDWKTGEGIPVTDGRSCGENKVCDTDGNCVWVACEDENKERDNSGNCVCKNPLTCGDNQKFNEETCECDWIACEDKNKERDNSGNCVCKNPLTCGDNQKFNEETCECDWVACEDINKERDNAGNCVCKNPLTCGDNQKFNEETCECECDTTFCPVGCSDSQDGGCIYGCFQKPGEERWYYGNNADTAYFCPAGCDDKAAIFADTILLSDGCTYGCFQKPGEEGWYYGNNVDTAYFCPAGCETNEWGSHCTTGCFQNPEDNKWYYGSSVDTASFCPVGCSDSQEGGCTYGCFQKPGEEGWYYGNNVDTAYFCPAGCDDKAAVFADTILLSDGCTYGCFQKPGEEGWYYGNSVDNATFCPAGCETDEWGSHCTTGCFQNPAYDNGWYYGNSVDDATFCPGGCSDSQEGGCTYGCFQKPGEEGWYYGNNADTATFCPGGCSDSQEGGCIDGCFQKPGEEGWYYGNNVDTAYFCPGGCSDSQEGGCIDGCFQKPGEDGWYYGNSVDDATFCPAGCETDEWGSHCTTGCFQNPEDNKWYYGNSVDDATFCPAGCETDEWGSHCTTGCFQNPEDNKWYYGNSVDDATFCPGGCETDEWGSHCTTGCFQNPEDNKWYYGNSVDDATFCPAGCETDEWGSHCTTGCFQNPEDNKWYYGNSVDDATFCPGGCVSDQCKCDNANNYYGEVGSCQLCDSTKGEVMNGSDCVCDNSNEWYGLVGACMQCKDSEGKTYDADSNQCVCNTTHVDKNNDGICVSKCQGYFGPPCKPCNPETGEEYFLPAGSECNNNTGTCDSNGECKDSRGVWYSYQGVTFLRSPSKMNGISAITWCSSKGYTLASLADTGITGGWNGDSIGCGGAQCLCGKDQHPCTDSDWLALADSFSDLRGTATQTWWTSDNWHNEQNYAMYIFQSRKIVHYHFRDRNSDFYALCKVSVEPVCDEQENCVCGAQKYYNNNTNSCTECVVNYGAGYGACGSDKPICNAMGVCELCPNGTSVDGAGGIAVPEQCKCDVENMTWDEGEGKCVCPPGEQYWATGNQCVPLCRPEDQELNEEDGSCVCKDSTKEEVEALEACMTPCVGDQVRDPNNGYNCTCPGTGGTLNGEVCCNTDTKFAWNESTSAYDKVLPGVCGCPDEFTEVNGACAICSTENEPRFVTVDGVCRSCLVEETYGVTEEDACAVCGASLRRFVAGMNMCVKNTCDSGQFYDREGTCYECDAESMPETTEAACVICKSPNLRHWVTLKEGETTKRVCAKPCEAGQFRDWEGSCFACSEPTYPHTDEVENNECRTTDSKRIYVNGLSLLCTHNARLYSTKEQCEDSCGSLREWHGADGCWLTCGENEFHDVNGTCQPCSTDGGITPAPDESEVCSEKGQKRFLGLDGMSYSCDNKEELDATLEECNKCGTIDNTTTDKRRVIGYGGKCIYNCGSGKFLAKSKTCVSCGSSSKVLSTQAQSHQCVNRFWTPYAKMSPSCISDCTYGSMSIPCDINQEAIGVEENDPAYAEYECGLCGANNQTERVLLTGSSYKYCAKKCNSNEFHRSNGLCISCATASYDTYSYNDEECLNCNPSRGLFHVSATGTSHYCSKIGCNQGSFQQYNGQCIACGNSSAITPAGTNDSEKSAESASCNYEGSLNRRFMGSDGNSYSCKKTEGVKADPEESAKCGSRFMASDGKSYPCDYASALTVANEAACNSVCTSRQYSETDHLCYKSVCDGFRSTDGTCYACDTDSKPKTTVGESDKCKNTENPRFYVDDDTDDNSYDNTSWRCTDTRKYGKASLSQCNNCSSRVLIDDYCVMTCGTNTNYFLARSDRSCKDCNSYTAYEVVDSTYCEDQCNTAGQTADKLRDTVVINGKNICQRRTCPDGYIHQESTGTCINCDNTTSSGMAMTDNELEACKDIGHPRFKAKDGKTYLCSQTTPYEVSSDGDCTYYCGANNEVVDIEQKDGSVKKYCNKKCEGFFDRSGNCKTCDVDGKIDTTQAMCERCNKTRDMVDGSCVPACETAEFRDNKGNCASCSSAAYSTIAYSDEECLSCKDSNNNSIRGIFNSNLDGTGSKYCSKIGCDSGYFQTYNGYCASCSSAGYSTIAYSDEECLSCKDSNNNSIRGIFNSKIDGTGTKYCSKIGCTQGNFQEYTGNCIACSKGATTPAGANDSEKSAESAKCNYESSTNRRFLGSDGKSYLCSINEAVSASQEECNRCDGTNNTKVRSYNVDNGTCELACAQGTQFRDVNGVCQNCSDKNAHDASKEENDKCTTNKRLFTTDGKSYICSDSSKDLISDYCSHCVDSNNNALRVLVGEYCVLPCAKTDGNTIGGFHDNADRSCVSCDIKDAKEVFQEAECTRCNAGSNSNLRYTYQQGGKLYCALTACDSGYFRSQETGTCVACNASSVVHVNPEEEANCLACGRVLMDNKLCVTACTSSNNLHKIDGTCTGCNGSSAIETFASELSNCTTNPRFIDDNGMSYLCSTTTDPAPASTTSDSMASCTASTCGRTLFNGKCAQACSSDQFHSITGKCTGCKGSSAIETFASELSNCTTNPRFIDDNGMSYLCNTTTDPAPVSTTSHSMTSCTVSTCGRTLFNGRCAPTCNSDQFHSITGKCTKCSDSTAGGVETLASELSNCTTNPRFIDDNGMSYKCTVTDSVYMINQTSIDSCNACSQRTYDADTHTCVKS